MPTGRPPVRTRPQPAASAAGRRAQSACRIILYMFITHAQIDGHAASPDNLIASFLLPACGIIVAFWFRHPTLLRERRMNSSRERMLERIRASLRTTRPFLEAEAGRAPHAPPPFVHPITHDDLAQQFAAELAKLQAMPIFAPTTKRLWKPLPTSSLNTRRRKSLRGIQRRSTCQGLPISSSSVRRSDSTDGSQASRCSVQRCFRRTNAHWRALQESTPPSPKVQPLSSTAARDEHAWRRCLRQCLLPWCVAPG